MKTLELVRQELEECFPAQSPDAFRAPTEEDLNLLFSS